MGAPGYALFCGNGHLVRWWDEHLYWTDEMFDDLRKARSRPCICGNKDIIEIFHYGGINDCICPEEEQEERGIKRTDKVDEFLVPFSDSYNKAGIKIDSVYTKARLPVYYIPDDVKDGSRWKGKED